MAFEHSFGIEEEFFLVDAATGALGTPALDQLMSDARAKLGDVVTSELLQSQIEIASPILHSPAEAREVMSRTRRSLSEVVAGHGLQIVAASTHPLGVWQEQLVTEKRRYDKLMADFRIVSQRNLVCGLHIHVAIPEDVDRVDVMNRAMPWLPLFLALSTSSPFWNHRVTGLLSYRQALYDEWPRSGIPDFFRDEADYQAFVKKVRTALPETKIAFIAIKPSLSRWSQFETQTKANGLIREFIATDKHLSYIDVVGPMLGADGQPRPQLYKADRLHMTEEGYAIWNAIMKPVLEGNR